MKFYADNFDFVHSAGHDILNELCLHWERVATLACADVAIAVVQDGALPGQNTVELAARCSCVIVLDYSSVVPDLCVQRCKNVADSKIRCVFKRELKRGHAHRRLNPLDFTVPGTALFSARIATKEEYYARNYDIFYSWGFSNPGRPQLHGALLRSYLRFGDGVPAQTLEDMRQEIQACKTNAMALVYLPAHRRVPMHEIYDAQQQARISVSLAGDGRKCWRSTEAAMNTLVAQQNPSVVEWAYPWLPGENCIGLPDSLTDATVVDADAAVETLFQHTRVAQGNLYELYKASMANAANYVTRSYVQNYVIPTINKAI